MVFMYKQNLALNHQQEEGQLNSNQPYLNFF